MRILPLNRIAIEALVTLLAVSGCALGGRQSSSAKWAMDDQQYAQEHSVPYSSDPQEQRAQKAWDRTDARFQEGNSGVYVGGGSTAINHWPVAAGSMGVFKMPTSWSTIRGGVMGLDNNGIGVGGIEGSLRLHAPTRFTPYVGLSGEAGFSGLRTGLTRQGYGATTQRTPTTRLAGIAAIGPEAGVSYWLNSSTRLNAGASYFIAGNQPDFLFFGMSLEFVLQGGSKSSDDSNVPRRIDRDGNEIRYDENTVPYFLEPDEWASPVDRVQSSFESPVEEDASVPATFTSPDSGTGGVNQIHDDLPPSLVPQSNLFRPESLPSTPAQSETI